jgi:hypothetical protein
MSEKFIDILPGTGWSETAPWRSLDPTDNTRVRLGRIMAGVGGGEAIPAFRHAVNVAFDYGRCRMRPTIADEAGPTVVLPNAGNDQATMWIHRGVVAIENATTRGLPVDTPVTILVTSREVWLNMGSWVNLTPTYTTGTVTVTNGSATVAGAATAWSARFIAKGDLFSVDGTTWYRVTDVVTGVSLTLHTTYAGSTAAGSTYIIRRCFGGNSTPGNWANNLTACLFNGDLYIAGNTVIGLPGRVTAGPNNEVGGPGVLKIGNIFNSGNQTTTYLMARHPVVAGIATFDGNAQDRLLDILGMELMQDGRVLLATHEQPTAVYLAGQTQTIGNRLRYSSHLDTTVWTTPPGGFVDLVGISDRYVSGLKGIRGSFAVHFPDAIALAHPSGQDDPPVRIESSASRTGTIDNHSIATDSSGGQFFVDEHGGVFNFNGSTSQKVTEGLDYETGGFQEFSGGPPPGSVGGKGLSCGAYDPFSGAYWLALTYTGSVQGILRYDTAVYQVFPDGRVAKWIFGNVIFALGRSPVIPARMVAGLGTGAGNAATALYASVDPFGTTDSTTPPTWTVGGPTTIIFGSGVVAPYVTTDYLSPAGPGNDWTLSRLTAWLARTKDDAPAPIVSQTVTAQVRTVGSTSATNYGVGTRTVSVPAASDTGDFMVEFTDVITGEALAAQLTVGSLSGSNIASALELTRLRLWYTEQGPSMAVAR